MSGARGGLRALGNALKALTYAEMMEAAEIFKELMELNNGPIAKAEMLAESFNDFRDALDSEEQDEVDGE